MPRIITTTTRQKRTLPNYQGTTGMAKAKIDDPAFANASKENDREDPSPIGLSAAKCRR